MPLDQFQIEGKGIDDDGSKFDIEIIIDELTFGECYHGFMQEQNQQQKVEIIFPDLKIPFEQDPEFSPNAKRDQTVSRFQNRKPDYSINGTLDRVTNKFEFTLKR